MLSIAITVPSYWRDEAATVAALHRPAGALLRMLGHVDAVHAVYYLLMWPVGRVFGDGELALRLPSVLAVSAAAGVVAETGRRLASPAAGFIAGLLFAVVPSVSLYGQMARSYALVILAASIASLALVRALGSGDRRRQRWYAASLALLGALNIFGLLLIPAHAITILAAQRSRRALRPGRPRAGWVSLPRWWLLASAFAVAVTSPLLVLGYRQRSQISWVARPGIAGVKSAAELMGPPWMSTALLLVTVGGLAATRRCRRPDPGRTVYGQVSVAMLGVPWLVLPAVLLLGESELATPVYSARYVMFCVPAGALLAGSGLAAAARRTRHRRAGLVQAGAIVVLVAALGLGQQMQVRMPGGHGDNIAEADEMIAASWRPGDAVYYPSQESMTLGAAYPDGLSWLRPVQVSQPAIASGTLAGTRVPTPLLRQRLSASTRFWIVQLDGLTSQNYVLDGLHVRLAWTWQVGNLWLQLYVRSRAVHGLTGVAGDAPAAGLRTATS